jgi:hypothetical protein
MLRRDCAPDDMTYACERPGITPVGRSVASESGSALLPDAHVVNVLPPPVGCESGKSADRSEGT